MRLHNFMEIFKLLLLVSFCRGDGAPENTRQSKIIVYSYPPTRTPEPYTYPGPSPPVQLPSKSPEPLVYPGSGNPISPPPRTPESFIYPGSINTMRYPESFIYSGLPTRVPDAYPMYVPPSYRPDLDFKHLPKWCKSMWDRDECGMKCWMLRKICRNMHKQLLVEKNRGDDSKIDSVGSSSIAYPYLQSLSPLYFRKPQPAVVYSKTGVSNTYYAQPSWPYSYPYYRRNPYNYFKYPSLNNELGLNPQFTYVDGNEKLPIRSTTKPYNEDEDDNEEKSESTTTVQPPKTKEVEDSTKNENVTAKPEKKKKVKPSQLKGAFPVQVTYTYPSDSDSEVTTLSPMMFDYDQYSNRKYYGDRIYMSAILPVSSRKLNSDDSEYDTFDDFDEIMLEP